MCFMMFAPIGAAVFGAAAGSTTAAALGTAVVATTVAGMGVSAYSAISSAKSQSDAAKYNAQTAENQAQDAINRGNIKAGEVRDKARRIQSAQVAQLGAAGLDINFGTPESLLSETKQYGELDALRAINNSQREATSLYSSADLERFQGRNAMRTGYFNAGGSLLSGATNLYGMSRWGNTTNKLVV
jgi:hypothetical protein